MATLTEPPKQLHSQGSIDKKQEHEKKTKVPYLHRREVEQGQPHAGPVCSAPLLPALGRGLSSSST